MARRMVVSVALAGLLPLSARHTTRSETTVVIPGGTERVTVQTDTVPMPQRAMI
jgi:hypothetical protein